MPEELRDDSTAEDARTNTSNDPNADLEGSDEGDLNSPQKHRIHLEKSDRSLAELKRWHDRGRLILDPDWQRNYVWKQRQASKLIESFLLGIPVPVVYLAINEEGKYEVIDGQQRLRSVLTFLTIIIHFADWTSLLIRSANFRRRNDATDGPATEAGDGDVARRRSRHVKE